MAALIFRERDIQRMEGEGGGGALLWTTLIFL